MNMAKILKNAGIFVLCMAMCLAIAVPSFAAENVAAESSARYFFGSEEAEDFSQVGDYTVKWDVCNYGNEAVTAVILTGKFKGEKLQGVDISDEPKTITTGAKITLEETVTLTEADVEAGVTLESYLWKSTQSLVPVGGGTPDAPTGLEITNVTNSTVDLRWDKDTTGAIESYQLYRNGEELDSSYITETEGKMSYYDVGIEHNTPVSYTVKAVDFTGKESAASDAVEETTDDIARLWLGGLTDGTSITKDNFTSLNKNAYNLNVSGVLDNGSLTFGNNTATASLTARSEDTTTGSYKLGLEALDFNGAGRIYLTLDDEFKEKIKVEEELNLIFNYFDSRVIGAADSSLSSYTILSRYSTDIGGEEINGATGVKHANSYMWKTAQCTIPTINNTNEGFTSGTSALYTDVFKDRAYDFATAKADGTTTAATNGYDASISIGSNNKDHASYYYNGIIQKVIIAGSDYIPYGAVLDFNEQEDNQYVEWQRSATLNSGAITTVSSTKTDDKEAETKKVYTLEPRNYLKLNFSTEYIESTDKDFIIRITYLDNNDDPVGSHGLNYVFENQDGGKYNDVVMRKNTGEWKTAEIPVDNAKFNKGLTGGISMQLGGGGSNTPWYISRVEVIKRTK